MLKTRNSTENVYELIDTFDPDILHFLMANLSLSITLIGVENCTDHILSNINTFKFRNKFMFSTIPFLRDFVS